MCKHNRRAVDRFPLTDRLGWAFWRAVDRTKSDAADILGSMVVGSILIFAVMVVVTWAGGA